MRLPVVSRHQLLSSERLDYLLTLLDKKKTYYAHFPCNVSVGWSHIIDNVHFTYDSIVLEYFYW